MKKIFYIFSALLAVVATGCSSDKDIDMDLHGGKGLEFVHFASPSDSWLVQESDDSYVHDVVIASTYTHDEDVTYSVSLGENTTGVEGTDFSIPTKSVTIKAGEYTGKLPVKILYDTTGEGFEIELVLSVDDKLVNPIFGNTSFVTVKTDKITIDWDWLTGNWTAQDTAGDPYPMVITKKDENTAVFTNIAGAGGDIEGTVDFENRKVKFQGPFNFGDVAGASGDLMLASTSEDGVFYATMSPLGIVVTGVHYYIANGPYAGYDFGEETTTLTR